MPKTRSVSIQLIQKLVLTFFLVVLLMGAAYIFTTVFFMNRYVAETSQKLNAHLADHLITEKFKNEAPFLEDGSVNKALFGGLMHDMMAVNPSIEVYLLDDEGLILYSVVLDEDDAKNPMSRVDLAPVEDFMKCGGQHLILGDDPRNQNEKKIFSAAPYKVGDKTGFIYIVLAGQALTDVNNKLLSSLTFQLGIGAGLLTMIFSGLGGFLAIWFLTKNLRVIIDKVQRFREGDIKVRVTESDNSDLSVLATTFNDMADTIERNIDEIKSVDLLRRELIANVSHDLRTPLAVLRGYIETLQIKGDSLSKEDQEKYLNIIHTSSEQLSTLVSQLFEYSKLEAKQVEPVKEPFSILDLVYDLNAKYQVIANEKNITLEVGQHETVPLVFADISLVERAIQNLMDNAMKFTPENGVIKVVVDSTKDSVVVNIKDSGPGIPEEEQAQIFERYRQAKGEKATKSGVGLGLAIVKKIMELHDSTIRVMSKPNEGSTFYFSLPSYQA
ncbi:sensor histidine kinase [Reichenbachiella versicolor]|uniref:sensor histidine kinase n=1 Tax=Reichenbachiella versicolor TaxID=1821036 RepID=UPI000D6E2DAE|nr:HAMP domain-containing sensor histidine kinase [Reichenbachiella versicolor]